MPVAVAVAAIDCWGLLLAHVMERRTVMLLLATQFEARYSRQATARSGRAAEVVEEVVAIWRDNCLVSAASKTRVAMVGESRERRRRRRSRRRKDRTRRMRLSLVKHCGIVDGKMLFPVTG